ncbi:MAG: M23 family metallopeptidase [Bacteroidota bacterium]
MASLSTEQIDQVIDYLANRNLDGDFREELVDQICCELEAALVAGQAFNEAWSDMQSRWPPARIKKLNNSIQFIKFKPMLIKITAAAAALAGLIWLLPGLPAESETIVYAEKNESTEVQIKDESAAISNTTDEMQNNLRELQMRNMRFTGAIRQDILKPRLSPLKGVALVDAHSGFGIRKHPISGEMLMHNGIDLVAPLGTPVFATADGVVVFAGPNGANGIQVRINHQGGYTTVYNHLQSHENLIVGQPIFEGAQIAKVGSTGASTGPHLHYEVRKNDEAINPC